jgi:hypothetical protein
MSEAIPLGWRCSWQDYRGWRTRNPKEKVPPVHLRDFATREEAQCECRIQRAAGMTACVSPVAYPKPKRKHKFVHRVLGWIGVDPKGISTPNHPALHGVDGSGFHPVSTPLHPVPCKEARHAYANSLSGKQGEAEQAECRGSMCV